VETSRGAAYGVARRDVLQVCMREIDSDRNGSASGALRAKRHRDRKRARELQVAVGIARLVLGQSAGEQRRAILELLERAGADGDLPPDYARVLEKAIDSLIAQRR